MTTPASARVFPVRPLAVALALWASEASAQGVPNAELSFEQASARLRQVSDALVAAAALALSR